mmetsp:Transcript_24162/g.36547  ORF Transcript_24162/g.36547 Transcript_24162/m.36547 type:complete len:171 (+) Transcript_24162:362-874(+)
MTTSREEVPEIMVNNNNKRMRLVMNNDEECTSIPMLLVIQYLYPKERLSLAVTCQKGKEQVEYYCKLLLSAINNAGLPNRTEDNKNNSINKSIRERLVQYIKHRHNIKNNGDIPDQLVLEWTKKISLCTFVNRDSSGMNYGLELLPSQTRIATFTDSTVGETLQVFDLDT